MITQSRNRVMTNHHGLFLGFISKSCLVNLVVENFLSQRHEGFTKSAERLLNQLPITIYTTASSSNHNLRNRFFFQSDIEAAGVVVDPFLIILDESLMIAAAIRAATSASSFL